VFFFPAADPEVEAMWAKIKVICLTDVAMVMFLRRQVAALFAESTNPSGQSRIIFYSGSHVHIYGTKLTRNLPRVYLWDVVIESL